LDRAHSIAKQVVDHGGDYIVGFSEATAAPSLDFFEEDFDECDEEDGEDVDFEEDDFFGVRFRDIDEMNMLDSSTPPDAPPDPPQPNRR
jgi:hypothetical protein